ncbi:MAG: hypothetical protein ACYCV0_20590 [Desulfitobacteriaceae bacterium]
MIPKEKLQQKIFQMTKSMTVEELEKAIKILESLIGYQTLEEHLANPQYDDEPLTVKELQAIAQAKEDIKNGEVYSLEEVMRELGDL